MNTEGQTLLKYDYQYYLAEARAMSRENLAQELKRLRELSDDPRENEAPLGIQQKYAAYLQVVQEKVTEAKASPPKAPKPV